MSIDELLKRNAVQYEHKPAIIFQDHIVTFDQMRWEVYKLAEGLRRLGIGRGDKIGIYLPNCPEYAFSYLACFCCGAVAVPLDFMLKEEELISCLDHSETKVLIAAANPAVNFSAVKNQLPGLQKIIALGPVAKDSNLCFPKGSPLRERQEEFLDGRSLRAPSEIRIMQQAPVGGGMEDAVAYQDVVKNDPAHFTPAEKPDDKDPALILYTSGTTGKPKGILLTYKHLEGSPMAMRHFVDLTDRDVKLAALPLSHSGGFIYLQNCITFGIPLVLMPRFQPMEFLENIQRYKVTCFHIVPPMYTAILTLKQIEKFDLSSLRWMVVFGAPSAPEMLKRFHQYCPHARLLNGWGMTETCPPNTVTPMNSDNIASVGKPAPHCHIRILDENGKDVPVGEIGEIVVQGWIVMQEYYKDPDGTAAVKRPEGLHTGDLGRFDPDGFLYIVGRKKEMIKVGGQIVYAPEVESVLYKHASIAEAAVIGIPEEFRGEAVKAFVVLKEGAGISPDDIRYFCRERLARFKVPHFIEIRSELPKNRAGKIDKVILTRDQGSGVRDRK